MPDLYVSNGSLLCLTHARRPRNLDTEAGA